VLILNATILVSTSEFCKAANGIQLKTMSRKIPQLDAADSIFCYRLLRTHSCWRGQLRKLEEPSDGQTQQLAYRFLWRN